MRPYRTKAFTLIEVLIAIFIFAIMATIAVTALKRIFMQKKLLNQHIEQMQNLQFSVAMLRLDLSQIIDRPVRNAQGKYATAVVGSENSLSFTRTGNINPLGYFTLSNLQRIHYTCDGKLNRSTWEVLDLTTHNKQQNRVFLPEISSCHITYFDDKLRASSQWPALNQDQVKQENPLPKAIDIQFTNGKLGSVDVYIPIFAGNLHEKTNTPSHSSTS